MYFSLLSSLREAFRRGGGGVIVLVTYFNHWYLRHQSSVITLFDSLFRDLEWISNNDHFDINAIETEHPFV